MKKTTEKREEIFPVEDLKNILSKELKKKIGMKKNNSSRVLRFEYKTESIDPLLWLRSQKLKEKIYFNGRGRNNSEMSALGCAMVISSNGRQSVKSTFKKIRRELSEKGAKFYGGISFFRPGKGSEEWNSFGDIKFVLPRFEYTLHEDRPVFAANYLYSELNGNNIVFLLNEIESLVFSNFSKFGKTGKNSFEKYIPDMDKWNSSVSDYLKIINRGEIEKIVAARRIDLQTDTDSDPFKTVDDLRKSGDYCFDFLLSFDSENFFIGSTPERLFYREGDLLVTESVAGTAPRGTDESDDEKLGNALLTSKKEELEHSFVTDDIVNKLGEICKPIGISERVLLKLSTLQHLYRRISGKILSGIFDGEILEVLFPTPAVAGLPVEDSLRILESVEKFDRGWYSGVVGFVSSDVSDYYVSIRSILKGNNKIFIYSGAGIVKGSDPKREWDEISLKTEKYRKIFKYEI